MPKKKATKAPSRRGRSKPAEKSVAKSRPSKRSAPKSKKAEGSPAKRSAPKKPSSDDAANKYEARKERERQRQADQSAEGRDIESGMPAITAENKPIRKKCDASLKYFCLEIFPEKFDKDFSPDHEKAIAKMEASIVDGLLFALSMPRGSGKTTLIICAVIWAMVTGRRRYVALIGPTAGHAKKLLRTIKVAFETNDRLLELYPEACYPVRRLEGIANRCRGQTIGGERTHIEWTKTSLVLATVPKAPCSGAIIEIAGMTGSIRGMQHAAPTGETLRPDIVIIDDPQTKKSAKSDTQCDDRLETIQGDILGLAGPGKDIAGFLLCTVIRKGDVADRLLDHEEYPDWQGERFKLVYDWPENEELWDQYAEILAEELASGRGLDAATEFYRKHRKKMDRGARVGWEERYRKGKGELSAIQHAYNLLLRDENAFWCEYMNEPRDPHEDTELLTVDELIAKQSGYLRGVVPPAADTLTAFVDIQGKCLYWMVVAWRSSDFSGWIIDYGAYPDQKVAHFQLSGVRHTLAKKYKGAGLEGRTKAGLIDLVKLLADREFKTPGGDIHRVRRIGIDAAWGPVTTVVQEVGRISDHAANVMPTFGQGIKPTNAPMEAWKKHEGEKKGHHWIVRRTKGGGRHVLSDVNYWKTFIHNRFGVRDGDKGSLCLPKPRPRYKTEHRMVAEHCRSEKRTHVIGEKRRGDIWAEEKGKDNHLFDCLVHCAVLASIEGATLVELPKPPKKKKKRRGYAGSLAA